MTSSQSLSRIRKVHPRTVWPDEARNFTKWLERNVPELGVALGIPLKVEEIESPVGHRYLDILATDTSNGRRVIIENQLEISDGDHLSRLLVYAAGKDADVIIWLAREFREEHWLALKWLNQRAGSRTKFFGVAIEVLRIDGSPPAPHFRVVVAPDDWRRQELRDMSGSERRQFRQALEGQIKQAKLPVQPNGDNSNPWLSIHYKDNIRYSVDFNGLFSVAFQLESEPDDRRLKWCRTVFERLGTGRSLHRSKTGAIGVGSKLGR